MEQSINEVSQNNMAAEGHVPDWAFIVIIVSIFLSALAFCIGTCINKRKSLRYVFYYCIIFMEINHFK